MTSKNYNKTKKQGILNRMKQIWEMWKIVTLFYKNRKSLASHACKEDFSSKFDERVRQIVIEKFKNDKDSLPEGVDNDKLLEKIYKEVKDDMGKYKDSFVEGEFYSYHKEPRVNREDLVSLYLEKTGIEPNIFQIEDEEGKEKNRQLRLQFNSVVESCIDPENSFIKVCDENLNKVYLTAKGKKFAGIDGLLKAWIIEFGVLSSVITTAIVVGFPWIVKLSEYLSPWW